MKVELFYGKEKKTVNIPDPCNILIPNKVPLKKQDELIKKSLNKPINSIKYDNFIKNSERLLVIVNDATRPTPTAKVLEYLCPHLSKHPDIKFLIATGCHRAPTKDEYKFIFGSTYKIFQDRIYSHDSRNDKDMVYLGDSKNGTKMYINKLVTEYQNIIVIGSVEPHYFAGFTGGRKSFLPGVASYQTIEMNHKLALSDKACSLALMGNPVNEDMIDAMNVLKELNVFSIQTVLTGDHKIYAVTCGDLIKSFDKAIDYAKQVFCVKLKEKGNIVVTVAPYPMDIDLYQSQKALDNGKLALEDGGIIILVSKCRDGIGETAFLDLLSKASSPKDVFEIIKSKYKLGYHKAAKMAQIGLRAQMWAVTDIDHDTIKKALLKPCSDLQSAIDDAVNEIKKKGKKPKTIVMPSGSLTVPLLTEN